MTIDIICPLYNEEDVVVQSLTEILKQMDAHQIDGKIIVIDDHSKDQSFKLVNGIHDERIESYQTEKNSGSGGMPRNRGIEKAKSEFIMFYDIGDELNLQNSRPIMDLMRDNDINMALFKHQDIHPNGKIFDSPLNVYKEEIYPTSLVHSPQLISNPFAWSKIYSRNWVMQKNIRFGSQYSGQDKVFTWSAYLNANAILIVPQIMYKHVFFNDGRNRMTKINKKVLVSLKSIDHDVRSIFKEKGLEKNLQYAID